MDLALILLLCSSLVAAEPVERAEIAPDTLVVCHPALQRSMIPWLRHRQRQGHRLAMVTDFATADEIKASVRQAARGGRLRFVVLVGDVGRDADAVIGDRVHVPTQKVPAQINVRWGSEPEIATDNWFVDLNEDGIPEYAVGRLSSDTPEQLEQVVDKILTYEAASPSGLWRRRVNFVAGVGGFGVLADTVLESATRTFIGRGIPEAYRTSMTYASWRSPYCPDPRRFRDTTIGRMNEGCLFWVYIGHGRRQGLDWIRVPTGIAPILESKDVPQVNASSGMPIAIFLSCYTGAFDGPQDCLGEQLLRQQKGPVAVLAGSRVTMPYGMAVLSNALMDQVFEYRQETLGEALLASKRQIMTEPSSGFNRRLLDALASSISPNPDDLEGECREHLQLFNLLGDPLLRLRHPGELHVSVKRPDEPGGRLQIECQSAVTGTCLVELVCRRGRFTYRPLHRLEFDGTHDGMKALTDEYRRANDDRYVSRRLQTVKQNFETTLPVPAGALGSCRVRVCVWDDHDFAMGSAAVSLSAPKPAQAESPEGDSNP